MKLTVSLVIVLLLSAVPAIACDFQISSPANGATVLNPLTLTIHTVDVPPSGVWMTYHLDGHYVDQGQSTPVQDGFTAQFGSVSLGSHTMTAYESGSSGVICQQSVTVTVADSEYRIISPANGATVSGTTNIQVNQPSGFGGWANVHWGHQTAGPEPNYIGSTPPWTIPWNTTSVPNGSYQVDAQYKTSAGQVGDPVITVTVQNAAGSSPTPTPTPTPGPTPTPVPGATPTPKSGNNWIQSMSGAPTGLATGDTNCVGHYGKYSAPGTYTININGTQVPMIGGPLCDDYQSASVVLPTNYASSEGSAERANVDYFQVEARNNSSDYINQVNSFHSEAGSSSWGGAIGRIDGACPLQNPTVGEALQWSAIKWGINPLLGYAVVVNESGWHVLAVGDCDPDGSNCASHGLFQVADRNTSSRPNHAFAGFTGASANLAQENACFNADFFMGRMWAAFYGYKDTPSGNDNILIAIQSWYQGYTTSPGPYSDQTTTILDDGWQSDLARMRGVTFPNNQFLTGAGPQPVSPTP